MDKDKEFSKLYQENYEILYNTLRFTYDSGQLAEDVVQETFLEAWKKYNILCSHPNTRGWLMKTACLKMRNVRKKMQMHEVPLSEENLLEKGNGECDSGFEIKEMNLFLDAVMTSEERRRFKRYYIWGYSPKELAALEGVTENNVRVRISRLLKKLRREVLAGCLFCLAAGEVMAAVRALEKLFL